ncbi:MAG: hypothetical protein PHN42_02735 [Bacilli bacterium]|nr:hypothetical protein [Bacilli bacterium]
MNYNVEKFINNIIENEKLLPGDKISIDEIEELSKKYKIKPRTLCLTVLNISESAFVGLYSEYSNSKNCIILKNKIPEIVDNYKRKVTNILETENIDKNQNIDFKTLSNIAKKYDLNEKIFIIDILGIPSYTYNKIKNAPKEKIFIENKYSELSSNFYLALEILKHNNLKIGDKIDYNIFTNIMKKNRLEERELCSILGISKSSIAHMRSCHNKPTIILKKVNDLYYKKVEEKIKKEISDNYLISYDELIILSDKYLIHPKLLATKVLRISDNQFYNLVHGKSKKAVAFKSDYLDDIDIEKYLNIFLDEGFNEGKQINYKIIVYLSEKYNLSISDVAIILGISKNSLNFIKREKDYNAIIRNPIKRKRMDLLIELIPWNQYIKCDQLKEICNINNLSISDFINYVIRGQRNSYYKDEGFYNMKIDRDEFIWIGDNHPLSEKFINNNYDHLKKIFEVVSTRLRYNYSKSIIEDDVSMLFEKIYKDSGILEKNFCGDELFVLIYRRATTILKYYIYSNFKTSPKIKNRNQINEEFFDNIYLREEGFEEKIINNQDDDLLGEMIKLVENGISENVAIQKILKNRNISMDELKKRLQ